MPRSVSAVPAITVRRLPPELAQDVLHPARRRGPGIGPICVRRTWRRTPARPSGVAAGGGSGAGYHLRAPWGSAGILPIPWMYLAMMGGEGLRRASEARHPARNYMDSGSARPFRCSTPASAAAFAHEFILACALSSRRASRPRTSPTPMDYGFHAPTMSFTVAGTLMIEPTESGRRPSSTGCATPS